MSKKVRIIEVGPRDGLQNESQVFTFEQRLSFVNQLAAANLQEIEVASFVSPKWIPQMAGSLELVQALRAEQTSKKISDKIRFSALVPNEKGMESALTSGVKEIAIFAACSESFSQKNINCSIEESFARFAPVIKLARKNKIRVRGYLSVCFGCPYEGAVNEKIVVKNAKRMLAMGAYEVSIGDTIGVANPKQVQSMVRALKKAVGAKKFALHLHDTRGMALANIACAVEMGVRAFDSSVGGLGGCPYAAGASGNVATEDVVHMLHQMGYATGVDLLALCQTARWLGGELKKELPAKISKLKLI